MSRVDAFRLDGLELLFYSNDHRPPHLHVIRRGHWEIRVWLLTTTAKELSFERKWGAAPSGADQKRIRAKVDECRVALLAEWEAKVDCHGNLDD